MRLIEGQNQVLERIVRGEPLKPTLDLLLRVIEAEFPGMLCSILLLDPDGTRIRHISAPSLPEGFTSAIDGEAIGPQAGSCGIAAYRNAPVVVEDIDTDPLWTDYRDLASRHGLRSCWSTPIVDEQNRVLGTFALYFRHPARPEARHWEVIELATHTAAIAIAKARSAEERRAAEAEGRRRQQQLEEAQRIAHLGSYVWWNQGITTLFGYPADEVGANVEWSWDRVHPDDVARARATLQHAVDRRENFVGAEYRFRRADGSYADVVDRGSIIHGADSTPVRVIGTIRDISERKRAMELLEQRVAARTAELHAKNLELEVAVCRDGEEAVRYIQAHGTEADVQLPALMLLDLRLPNIDGIDVLRHARAHAVWRKVPVVVLTTSRARCDIDAAYRLGVNSYLIKPIDVHAFARVIGIIKTYWLLTNEPPFPHDDGR
jgi:PAS domain S-box-containing protein